MKQKKLKGSEAFHQYYREIYGDRWDNLIEAFLSQKSHVAWKNPFLSDNDFLPSNLNEILPNIFEFEGEIDSPRNIEAELTPYYLLDAASVLAPMALKVEPGDKVLDLCAAPGGKTLLLSQFLGKEGTLTSNDKSPDRRRRLSNVLDDYLPTELRQRVRVTGFDASAWCLYEKDAYDKILLDAPCSSERHVLESQKHLDQWGLKRTKKLAQLQFAMLASALDVVKIGGRIVYSTCSISNLENDDIIEKLFKKREGRFELERPKFDFGEQTNYGHLVLPDKSKFGPFYLSVIKRIK